MFNTITSYLNQSSLSSFRMEHAYYDPETSIPTVTPKIEPLWKSVLLDYRDAPLVLLDNVVKYI